MRCQDLTRELAARPGIPPSGEAADHLAACPGCAEWSRRSDRLDRIWEETRPPEFSGPALDTLWARASAALGAPNPALIPFEGPARRRRWVTVALVGAQAAALLVAASLLLRRDQISAPARLTVGVDQTVVVHIGDEGNRVEVIDDSAQFGFASMAEATPHDVFNALESMASQ